MKKIEIHHANEKNLKDVSIRIPRGKLTVVTGLSGSGKTTLIKDVLYIEAQRQYLEAMAYQGIPKPDVEKIEFLSPAVLIDQEDQNRNPRSTLGTKTDIYTDLRMIYEKMSERPCPNCHNWISSAESKEETEKKDKAFLVYMYCPLCRFKMHKLTRSHFSFNTEEGACPGCKGLGHTLIIQEKLYDPALSLEEGAVKVWSAEYGKYQRQSYYGMLRSLSISIPKNLPFSSFSEDQRELLKNGTSSALFEKTYDAGLIPTTVKEGKFSGVERKIWEKIAEHKTIPDAFKTFIKEETCPDCLGEKLNPLSRSAAVNSVRLPEVERYSMIELCDWVTGLIQAYPEKQISRVKDYVLDIQTKTKRVNKVGLGYLTVNRSFVTLSGGEAQRIKLAAALESDMTGLLYILDEPTVGLHSIDTHGIIHLLKRLRDKGNTVIVIEHDEELIQSADYLIDMGPGSGIHGGQIIGKGSYDELLQENTSVTGQYLKAQRDYPSRNRNINQIGIEVKNACQNNLKKLSLSIPVHCLNVISGVSGSGKSTLLFDVIAASLEAAQHPNVIWNATFDEVISINQRKAGRNKRSVSATYLNIFDLIRKRFAKASKKQHSEINASDFSFNSPGGRCEQCQGLGTIESHQLFFENLKITCPECDGKRYNPKVLGVQYRGKTIADVLELTIAEAVCFFREYPAIVKPLEILQKTNLDYIQLGQTTDTLSGGEMQRLRLAAAISKEQTNQALFIMDEPTTGMHMVDVDHFMELIHSLIDEGHTFIFVEHNLHVISQADFVIELGPGGGNLGGKLVFSGSIADFKNAETQTSRLI